MSFSSNVAALFFLALAAAPFAGGCSSGNETCTQFCNGTVTCTDPKSCVYADPSGAESACATACQTGFDALSAAETTTVTACLTCVSTQLSGGTCDLPTAAGKCALACDSAGAQAATKKWGEIFSTATATSAGLCTNGKNEFGSEECTVGGDATTCSTACCNGMCGAQPDVGASCTTAMSGPASCTCTAGKSKGKTFQSPGSMGDACGGFDVWTECNL